MSGKEKEGRGSQSVDMEGPPLLVSGDSEDKSKLQQMRQDFRKSIIQLKHMVTKPGD